MIQLILGFSFLIACVVFCIMNIIPAALISGVASVIMFIFTSQIIIIEAIEESKNKP